MGQSLSDLKELLISTEKQIVIAGHPHIEYDQYFVACKLRRLRKDRRILQKAIFEMESALRG